jgi:hypothetical protein
MLRSASRVLRLGLLGICLLAPPGLAVNPVTRAASCAQEALSGLSAFEAPEGVSEEQFAEWVELAGSLNARSRQELIGAGRSAMPAIVNAMLVIDYTTKKGSRKGRDCHRLLAELLGQEAEPSWVVTDEPKEAQANHALIRDWRLKCERSMDSEEEWWRLRGFEPGPLLTALRSTGLTDGVTLELLKLQEQLDEARASFEEKRAVAAERLERMERERERELRLKLAESLPESWEVTGEEGAQAIPPAMVAKQLQGKLEIPWPLGLYESLRDSLRGEERDAWKDQRTIKVEELPEDIEVSVKTYGESQYAVVPLVRTWPEARDICRANGGHLACIGSFEELEVVLSLMSAVTVGESTYLEASEWNKMFWVGASDAPKEGDWRWLDGREVGSWLWLEATLTEQGRPREMPWGAEDRSQPSNNGGFEHCAALVHYRLEPPGEGGFRWGLMDWYSGFPARFICEWGPEPIEGPWEGETLRLMETYLLDYHRRRADLRDELEQERLEEERALRRARKKALSVGRSLARGTARGVEARISAERKDMTGPEFVAAERLGWLLEDPRFFSELSPLGASPPQDAVRLLNSSYKVFTSPKTQAEAEQACREVGGRLATLSAPPAASNLVLGSESPDLELLHTDLELQLYLALLREAGVELAWLGYRRYCGWGNAWAELLGLEAKASGVVTDDRHLDRGRWIQLGDGAYVEASRLLDELRPSFTRFNSSWPYHTIGSLLSSLELPRSHATFVVNSTDQIFASPFPLLPEYMVKVRIDGGLVTKEHMDETGRGFAFQGGVGAREVAWWGLPFRGGERVSFHPSPINSGPIHFRLPYICAWDG